MKEDILVDLLKDGEFKSRKYLASALNLEKKHQISRSRFEKDQRIYQFE